MDGCRSSEGVEADDSATSLGVLRTSPSERRCFTRVPVDFSADLRRAHRATSEVRALDLSLEGARLSVAFELGGQPGDVAELLVRGLDGEEDLLLRGTVMRADSPAGAAESAAPSTLAVRFDDAAIARRGLANVLLRWHQEGPK